MLELDMDMQELEGFYRSIVETMKENDWNYLDSIGDEDGDFYIAGAKIVEDGRLENEGTASLPLGREE